MVRTGWSFDYTRVGNLFAIVDMDAVVADPVLADRLERYLLGLLKWT
jgi:hypothetical protein